MKRLSFYAFMILLSLNLSLIVVTWLVPKFVGGVAILSLTFCVLIGTAALFWFLYKSGKQLMLTLVARRLNL